MDDEDSVGETKSFEQLRAGDDLSINAFGPSSNRDNLAVRHLNRAVVAALREIAAVGRLRELLVPGGQLVFVENTRDENLPLLVSMEVLEVAGRPGKVGLIAGSMALPTRRTTKC